MADLMHLKDPAAMMQEIEKLTTKLNIGPDKRWLQKTPDGKAWHIPVGIIENELRKDFAGLVQFEIISERRELNEYIVTARIRVFHPVIMQWMNYDGIGAVQITQDKDAALASFNETKKKNALQLNAPKAYAEALKNAAKKIGKKYGADINRDREEMYEPEYTLAATLDDVISKLKACNNTEEMQILWDTYPELHKSNKFKMAFTKRKGELK